MTDDEAEKLLAVLQRLERYLRNESERRPPPRISTYEPPEIRIKN